MINEPTANDLVRLWLAQSTTEAPGEWTSQADAQRSYLHWAASNRQRLLPSPSFVRGIAAAGMVRAKRADAWGYSGLRLVGAKLPPTRLVAAALAEAERRPSHRVELAERRGGPIPSARMATRLSAGYLEIGQGPHAKAAA